MATGPIMETGPIMRLIGPVCVITGRELVGGCPLGLGLGTVAA
jgi:hypothetical protein